MHSKWGYSGNNGISRFEQGFNGNGGNGGRDLRPVVAGPGSDANGGGVALNGGDTHPGCNIAIGHQCFNQPGG